MVVISALGLYLLLATMTWAAPQSAQSETAAQLNGFSTTHATVSSDIPDTSTIYLPVVHRQATPTPPPTPKPFPTIPGASYSSIPVDPYYYDGRPDYAHADLNLEIRGWVQENEYLGLWDYSGDTHNDAPHLAELYKPSRRPTFLASYRVYSWIWADPPATGTRGDPIYRIDAKTSLIKMQAITDEIIYLPGRTDDIYFNAGKTYYAQVLYATDDQITLVYTRKGNVVTGYVVHIASIWVDPQLVALYQACNAAGRYYLPALTNNQAFGRAKAGGILVAIRDTGNFMDPRSRKDWWPGY